MGLNDSYTNIRSQILLMNSLPTVGQAYSLFSQEESHRGILSIAGNYSFATTADNPTTSFYTRNSKIKSCSDQKSMRCEYCNWPGLNKENCYKLIGYPSGHRLYKGKKGSVNYGNIKSYQKH
ncbi:hypothetical protein CFOL_v3_33145 [Cephalotus follicularis]|uniref:Uncharacterized protein n=1 Tax=Cephalotus follicularis TaxID=3775 RepID=A0A1Q3DBA5_CEPFO|nr:hypothetical protein CFOL_v3_33145 [Cephalotus follicularis]